MRGLKPLSQFSLYARPWRPAKFNFFSKNELGNCRRYTSNSSRDHNSSTHDGWWAIGAMTITIPAAFWLYQRHFQKEKQIDEAKRPSRSDTDAIEVQDLRLLQTELALNGGGDPTDASFNQDSSSGSEPNFSCPLITAQYLLVGGGTASFSAMEAIRANDPTADILIISDEDHPPYLRPPLSKELWFNKDQALTKSLCFVDWHGEEKPVFFQPHSYFETSHIETPIPGKTRLLLGRKGVQLDIKSKTLKLDDGRCIVYDKILLATGGRPKVPPVLSEAPIEIRRHVYTLRNINDFQRLQNAIAPGQEVAIVGGGFLGSELAVALAQHSRNHLEGQLKITQFFPEEGNMALVFPRYLSRWTMSRVKKAGVKVVPKVRISGVSHDPVADKVILSLDDGTVWPADIVLVATGIEPNTELALQAGLELDSERGGIITNAELQARSDVYSAGDSISFYDPSLGVRRRVEHYDHAVLSGKCAGKNMVDSQKPVPYNSQSMFWSDLGPEVGYEAVGLVDSRLTTVGVWAEATSEDSPRGADLDPSDIRSQPIGNITTRHPDLKQTASRPDTVVPSPSGEKTYGKGVVFYVKDRRIVGMVMFNLFNRISLARDIIKQERTVEELQNLVELFNINDISNN